MRVLRSMWPLPSSIVLTAITMRGFGAGVCEESRRAGAQTTRMLKTHRMSFAIRMIVPPSVRQRVVLSRHIRPHLRCLNGARGRSSLYSTYFFRRDSFVGGADG